MVRPAQVAAEFDGGGVRRKNCLDEVSMTATVRNLLQTFDTLGPAEKQEILVEVLRRSPAADPIPDEAFNELAADVLKAYDAEESASANC